MPTPSERAVQDKEAEIRARDRGSPDPSEPDNLPADNTRPDPEVPPAPRNAREDGDDDQPQRLPPTRGKFEDKRSAIISRFRQTRTDDAAEGDESDAAQIRRFAREGMPPELLDTEQPDDGLSDDEYDAAAANDDQQRNPDPAPQKQPVKRVLKVRGKTIELTEDEIDAAAQKALAGEDYLNEGRQTLDEIKRMRSEVANELATARSQTAKHPGDSNAQNPGDQSADDGSEHPAARKKLVEVLQYDDPDEAEKVLNSRIGEEAGKATRQALSDERQSNELVRSHRFLKQFQDQNKEFVEDPFATAAMERRLYDLQREDLIKLGEGMGVDESKIPADNKEVARWHLYYRSHGAEVRDIESLLNQTKDDFVAWRGASRKDPAPPAEDTPPPPRRINVTVDRAARRAVIPQQPTRTVAPRPDAEQRQAPAPRDRSAIVQDMMKQRAAPRGKVLA